MDSQDEDQVSINVGDNHIREIDNDLPQDITPTQLSQNLSAHDQTGTDPEIQYNTAPEELERTLKIVLLKVKKKMGNLSS